VGISLDRPVRGLDFGCSSGRVVRVLAAAYPDVAWFGCDPLEGAIDWAGKNIEGVEFLVSPEEPPLPYEDSLFDFAFAISIWSHYSGQAALRWLEEMRRVLKPGGRLLLTTHGFQSVAYYARHGLRPPTQLAEIVQALYAEGFWYQQEWGEQGDWGIVNPDWGTAFFTSEWLLSKTCPAWRAVLFAPGRLEGNQDMTVLERP
jgi:SAM-dependent methyltransferase